MTIKQQGGIFGRNPSFNDVSADGDISVQGNLTVDTELGIAVTPAYPLHVSSGGATVVARFESTDPSASIELTDSVSSARITSSNSRLLLEADRSDEAASSEIRFQIDNSLLARMYDDGTLHLSGGGNLQMEDGAGIDFSATSGTGTSELFDDYEEGLYTATATPHTSGSITLKSTHNEASYTKVGRLVTVNALLQVDSVSSPVGTSVNISLPFAVANLDEFAGRFGGAANVKGTATPFLGTEGGSLIYIAVDASTIAGNDNFYLSFSYMAA